LTSVPFKNAHLCLVCTQFEHSTVGVPSTVSQSTVQLVCARRICGDRRISTLPKHVSSGVVAAGKTGLLNIASDRSEGDGAICTPAPYTLLAWRLRIPVYLPPGACIPTSCSRF
jgi:hypothetical protein